MSTATRKTADPKTARAAALNIAHWLKGTATVQAYDPTVAIVEERGRRDGSIIVLTGDAIREWDSSMVNAVAVVIYEGGPDNWTSVGDYSNGWDGVSEAEHRGELALGAFWPEAQNSWCVALYRD